MPEPIEYPRDPEQEIQVPVEDLQTLLSQMFVKQSVFSVDADVAAWRIVEADMRGWHSHGCRMVSWYLDGFDRGDIDPRGQVMTLFETVAMATLDGSRALGQVAATKAMELAIAKAREVGTGTVAVKNSHHLGAAGVYVQLAVNAGMIGYCTTSSGRATVAGYGTREQATSNHALAWGIPTRSGAPIVLDMSCAKASWGKIKALAMYGLPIPIDWAYDDQGEPTTDGKAVKTIAPAAGARGFGLGLISSVLAGALVGGKMPINRKRSALGEGSQHFFTVIDPEKFGDVDQFFQRIEEASQAIRALEPSEGFDRVRLPGERQWEAARQAEQDGVGVHRQDAETLNSLAEKMNLPVPWN